MTSSRFIATTMRPARLLLIAAATALLGACAALPDDAPIVEQLDTETGITVTRLGRPVELYRETFQQESAGRFAFLGPFETNAMGQRELFVWLAVPLEPVAGAVPTIDVNGTPLTLGTPGRAADFAGLHKSPYKIPTPWSAAYYFKVDEAVIAQLGDAKDLSVHVVETGKSGPIKTLFAVKFVADPHLKDFASR